MIEKLVRFFVELKIRLDRGNAWIYWFRNIILIVACIKYIVELNTFLTVIAGIGVVVLILLLGILDIDYLRSLQLEQTLVTSKYNPHLAKVSTWKKRK